jgi:hypothetical protein
MALQFAKNGVLACALGIWAGLGSGGAAMAASYTFNLTGNLANLSVMQGMPAQEGDLALIDTETGLNQTPEFELSAGDTLSGTVMLNKSLTIPGSGSAVDIDLFNLQTSAPDTIVNYAPDLSFFNKGAKVSPPTGFTDATGSVGGLILGGFDFTPPISSFAFDEIVFGATITSINEDGVGPIPSADILSGSPSLQYLVFPPFVAPVPEPATWAMMILGFGLVGLGARARRPLIS